MNLSLDSALVCANCYLCGESKGQERCDSYKQFVKFTIQKMKKERQTIIRMVGGETYSCELPIEEVIARMASTASVECFEWGSERIWYVHTRNIEAVHVVPKDERKPNEG